MEKHPCFECWEVINWRLLMIDHLQKHVEEYDNCADTCRLEVNYLLKQK